MTLLYNMAREQGWDHQFTAEFIEQYRRLPCLWKTTSNEYRDRTKMESAYNSLVSFCKSRNRDVDVTSVKRKIQCLRTVFHRVYKKYQSSKKSGARPDKIKKPYLWYFDLLLFVYEQDCPITTSSNVQVGTVASDQEVWTPLEEAHGIPYSPCDASTSSLEIGCERKSMCPEETHTDTGRTYKVCAYSALAGMGIGDPAVQDNL
ncbi:uncharacterized protein [Hyperolius riggenbachi]|uniref:uncharacterized protein isoform X2 n=1 Tax=Hyperolius riggenbachi TaxID=752182 RepID=UPI0035A3B718